MKNEIKNIAVLSILPGNTECIRKKLGIYNCKQFIKYIANKNNVDLQQAKDIILNNNRLMQIMFAIA